MPSKEISTTATNASHQIALINEHLTGPPAEEIVRRILSERPPPTPAHPLHILDNASGIGTLIFRAIVPTFALQPSHIASITGADLDENYLSYLRQRAAAAQYEPLSGKISALRLDQQHPGLESSHFDFIFNNFGVFFAPDDNAVLNETLRMLKPHVGIAGFTSWNGFSWWSEILLPALAKFIPDAPALPDPTRLFPSQTWFEPVTAKKKLQGAGFVDVQSEIWSFTPDVDPKDFALACAHLVKSVAARAWSEEAKTKYMDEIEPAFLRFSLENYEGGRWTGKMKAVLTWGRKE
ncbi:S-adenosyl-L-methionine-dependent methyltransferase [Gonapodya prolifera JEL478]|uniref:S-adenosyl-L-methionine-dependent methyltransferase n=1 Tax=Gonapodya prolifera (strain JEL478) TaxID=1344416 RepID=A0A139A806_GONPJ|nr:S-adenosyl-L-methionine-dependent methyltransferase [Gonapodya prolifera JEL478]|eukprot:KXS12513.1 S-adenosyl-L-methionine-dependent methyltransferase [Gonapodya prolifera JEL478]